MKITLTSIVPRRPRTKTEATDRLLADYIQRAARYLPCDSQLFDSEAALLDWLDRTPRPRPRLRDPPRQPRPAALIRRVRPPPRPLRDSGTQRLVLAIGPADGWSPAATQRANLLLSLGRITLPHQLARVVLAEQIYRALTILAGHPYHSGH